MTQPEDKDAVIEAVIACRFCTIGEQGPLICHQHAEAYARVVARRPWGCNACPGGVSRHPGLGHPLPEPPRR